MDREALPRLFQPGNLSHPSWKDHFAPPGTPFSSGMLPKAGQVQLHLFAGVKPKCSGFGTILGVNLAFLATSSANKVQP